MVAISKILSQGLFFASQDNFRDVGSPELAAKEQYNVVKYLSSAGPYIQHPGFGISTDIPEQCTIEQVQLIMRHGERYPGLSAGLAHKKIIDRLQSYNGTFKGDLAFLNDYKYYVSDESLYEYETTPSNSKGPFTGYETGLKAGASFRSKYSDLYKENATLPLFIAGSSRVRQTALFFAEGFLGENFKNNVVKEVILDEDKKFGLNTLVPRWGCPAWNSTYYSEFVNKFPKTYLQNIVSRFVKSNPGLNVTTSDVSQLVQICAYEMNAKGYSPFCEIFTEDELVQNSYFNDMGFYYNSGPGGKGAIEAGSVQLNASLALLKENDPKKKIWLSFTHDTDIELFSSALGLFETKDPLPNDRVIFKDSYHHVEVIPMGGLFVTEKYSCGNETYVRFVINDAVIPIESCNSGPGYSCKLSDFESYVDERIGHLDIPKDCGTPESSPKELTFYWDYESGKYDNNTAQRIVA